MPAFNLSKASDFKALYIDMFDGMSTSDVATVSDIEDSAYVGTFVDDSATLVALCVLDLPLAAKMAAAITMFPPGAAEDAVDDGHVDEGLQDNLHEIMNICSRLYLNNNTPHLKHAKVVQVKDAADEVKAFLEKRGDLAMNSIEVSLKKYGQGTATLITT
ncbi:MAG: hypothetical protein HRU20_20975 [Pseudomonadales bacterium]|nr:hypothetical protein [Pseudomonadales bacterium]